MTNRQAITRLAYLSKMLSKYAHTWGEYPSARMTGWVDEYNEIKDTHYEAFLEYCKVAPADPTHNAYDCLA